MAMAAAAAAVALIVDSVADNSDLVTRMSTSLKEVAAMKEDIQASFAAIGTGLKQAQMELNMIEAQSGAKISSVLANVALITTGQAAGEMNNGSSIGGKIASTLGGIVDAVKGIGSGGDSDKQITISMDSSATKDFLGKGVAKAHIKTGAA